MVDVEDADDVDFFVFVPSPLSENRAGGCIGSWYGLGKFDMLGKRKKRNYDRSLSRHLIYDIVGKLLK